MVFAPPKTPGFIAKINQYPDDIHHISFHPPIPYSTCLLYQHNPNENAGRSAYYDIFGTPKVYLDGTATGPQMVTDQQLDDALGKTSPVGIEVSESSGDDREVSVSVKTFGDIPNGNYKLYVAIAEKILYYNSPNGETEHHNVFRKFLADGDSFSPAANGEAVSMDYTYTLDSEWVADEIYVLAYLQNDDTKEVLNSGSRFDGPLTTSNKNLEKEAFYFQVSPNPASEQILVELGNTRLQADASISLLDVNGRVVWSDILVGSSQTLDMRSFASGLYFLRINNGLESNIRKIVLR